VTDWTRRDDGRTDIVRINTRDYNGDIDHKCLDRVQTSCSVLTAYTNCSLVWRWCIASYWPTTAVIIPTLYAYLSTQRANVIFCGGNLHQRRETGSIYIYIYIYIGPKGGGFNGIRFNGVLRQYGGRRKSNMADVKPDVHNISVSINRILKCRHTSPSVTMAIDGCGGHANTQLNKYPSSRREIYIISNYRPIFVCRQTIITIIMAIAITGNWELRADIQSYRCW